MCSSDLLMLVPLLVVSAAPAVEQPSPLRMKATVSALVGFGTRHSLSDPDDPKRGIGAARAWAKAQFDAIGAACGGCLTSETIGHNFTGPRAPNGVNIVDVLGVQKGSDPNRVVIVGGHIDSIVGDGSILSGGTVRPSIIGRNVRIHSGAFVEDSIIFDNCDLGRRARVRRAILDKNVRLPEDAVVGYDLERDRELYHVTDSGIVVVGGARSQVAISTLLV